MAGKVHAIIIDTERNIQVHREVKEQGGVYYTIIKGQIWIVELDHEYPFIEGSKVTVKVYRLVSLAVLS